MFLDLTKSISRKFLRRLDQSDQKLFQEINRIENWILGALSKLDKFLLKLQVRAQPRATPGTSRDIDREHQVRNESDIDPRPEVSASVDRSHQTVTSDHVQYFTVESQQILSGLFHVHAALLCDT